MVKILEVTLLIVAVLHLYSCFVETKVDILLSNDNFESDSEDPLWKMKKMMKIVGKHKKNEKLHDQLSFQSQPFIPTGQVNMKGVFETYVIKKGEVRKISSSEVSSLNVLKSNRILETFITFVHNKVDQVNNKFAFMKDKICSKFTIYGFPLYKKLTPVHFNVDRKWNANTEKISNVKVGLLNPFHEKRLTNSANHRKLRLSEEHKFQKIHESNVKTVLITYDKKNPTKQMETEHKSNEIPKIHEQVPQNPLYVVLKRMRTFFEGSINQQCIKYFVYFSSFLGIALTTIFLFVRLFFTQSISINSYYEKNEDEEKPLIVIVD